MLLYFYYPIILKSMEQVIEHTVTTGETLSKLAKKYSTTIQKLAADNNISDKNRILIWQKLKINQLKSDIISSETQDTNDNDTTENNNIASINSNKIIKLNFLPNWNIDGSKFKNWTAAEPSILAHYKISKKEIDVHIDNHPFIPENYQIHELSGLNKTKEYKQWLEYMHKEWYRKTVVAEFILSKMPSKEVRKKLVNMDTNDSVKELQLFDMSYETKDDALANKPDLKNFQQITDTGHGTIEWKAESLRLETTVIAGWHSRYIWKQDWDKYSTPYLNPKYPWQQFRAGLGFGQIRYLNKNWQTV